MFNMPLEIFETSNQQLVHIRASKWKLFLLGWEEAIRTNPRFRRPGSWSWARQMASWTCPGGNWADSCKLYPHIRLMPSNIRTYLCICICFFTYITMFTFYDYKNGLNEKHDWVFLYHRWKLMLYVNDSFIFRDIPHTLQTSLEIHF